MNPKKPKHLIKPTADALDLSETLVDDIVGFYWSAVRKALSDLESPSITVTNLGTFKVRYNKIDQVQTKYNNYLQKLEAEKMTFNKHAIQNTSKEKLDKLADLKVKMECEFQRKKEVQTKRTEYVNNKGMEEQREDTRGAEEQSI
jgi:hypothetical protein